MNLVHMAVPRNKKERDKETAAAIAKTIRARRVALSVSQQYLAGRAQCSLATIRNLEAGPPSLEMADRLDAALSELEREAVNPT